MPYIFLCISVVSNVTGQLFMKLAADRIDFSAGFSSEVARNIMFNPYVISGAGFYFVGLITWLLTLSKLELSIAYPFQAMTYVLVMAASFFLFKESITTPKIIGAVLILSGILVLSVATARN